MPLTYEETREYATLKGFNPDEVEVDPFSGEIRPRNRAQPTMSTAKPADKPKTTGALETIARQASLSAIPSAVSLPGSIAAGSAVTTALSPLFAGGPFTGWIPPVAGLATGLGVGVASSMAASKLQEKALEQFQGGREYLEKSAALREERPYMSVVGDVAGSLPTMKVDGKVLKDAWHALTTEGAQQGPRMLANKLATSQAAQDVLISGGVGGVSSAVEDKLADKEVDIPKALLNTVLQGAVSTPREYVGRFPGLKNAPYRGQPLAEPSPAVLGVNEMTRTVRTKEAATGDEAVRVAKEIESLNSQIGELEKIRIESEAAKHTEVVTQAKIQLKELKARNEELNKILKGEEKTTTDFVASPESMEFTKAKAAQKGVEDTTFNEGGRQTVDSAEGYGSFSNDGTKIRVNTYAGTKGVKTNLPEGLQGVPTTGAHETVHAELYNVINSEISSQSRLGEQLRAAYENDPQFKEAKAKRPDANFDWNEYATIRAAQKFAKNPSNEGRSWSAERKALSNVQKGKATADDADTVLLMKWRYDNGLNAPRGAVRANPNSTTPARNSLASNVEKEIKRVEEQPNTEQLDLPMAKEGSTLTKWQRENVADFEKPNFGPETRPAQNEFRFSKPEEENNKTFERAEAYAMARRRRNVENVEEGRQTSLDTATGATVDYVRTPEGLFVLSMDTPAESQGKGGATRLLNELRRKGPVILEANASEGEGLSQAQLTEFYTKRGLRNIGGNRFVGEPIVTPSVAAKTPVAAKPVEVKAPAEDATPIVSGQEQRVRTEGELKASTIEGQRAFVKKHPLLADFDENGKLKFFYEPKEWRSQELADWFGVTKRNINAYAERQGKSVREIDWNTVVNENQYKPINFPRREGVRGKAVRDEDTGRPLMRERPLNEKLDMDAIVSGELSNKDTYLPAIEAGVRTALFPKENSGEMARRGRTRFAATEGQNRWGSSIQTEAYVKRVTAEVYGAMAKEGLNVRGLDDKATFDDKIFKNAARIAERMLRDDVDVLKARNINESASTDAPRGDGRTLGDTISTSQRLVPAGERASTEGDEDLIKAVADRIAEKKAELSSQTGIVRATEAMSNERIAAAWAKILDEYEFGRVDAADVMEAAVKVSTELKLRGVPDADIKRGVLDRMRDAGIGADDSVDAQATARYSRPEADEPVFTTQLEKELRVARPFGLQVGRDGKLTSSEVLAKVKTLPAIEQELLKQSGLSDVLNVRSRIGADELTNWLKENGPKLEVHNYGMEGKVSEAKREYDKMTRDWYDNLNQVAKDDMTQVNWAKELVSSYGWSPDSAAKAERYMRLQDALKSEAQYGTGTGPRATSYYNNISAFDTNQPMPEWTASKSRKNVQRVDVVVPVKQYGKDPTALENVPVGTKLAGDDRSGYREHVKWEQDNLHENLPNTLGWAMIQYKDGPNGERIAVVAEAQSRWGQELRKGQDMLKERLAEYEKELAELSSDATRAKRYGLTSSIEAIKRQLANGQAGEIAGHPLLADTNRLILKSAIDQARKEGATHIFVSDAETAMMTEKLDTLPNKRGEFVGTEQQVKAYIRDNEIPRENMTIAAEVDAQGNKTGKYKLIDTREPEIERLKGFQQNYDKSLPDIASKLTNDAGQRVSLGEHKNALDNASFQGGPRGYDRRGNPSYRTDLIFTNPDGTPKTDVSGMMFDISVPAARRATGEEFSMAGRRYSRPEGDDVDPIRTSTDQTKQGPLEKLAPQFDQVRKFDSKVADAFERAEKIKSLNEANYLNTPLVDFRKQFGGANERELKRAYDYALEKYRNPESVDETAFSEREKAMANFWNERISQPTREHQQRLNMFVETREGLRRKAKLSESYAPEMLNDKAIDVFTKSVDSSESTRMKREWAEHVVKMSASADKPVSMEDAMNEINDFVAAIGRNGAHSADFGALTKAAGYGLPEEMRERNLMRVMQRYGRRSSRLLAKVEGLQSDEYVRGKLRLENPETGKRAEPEDGNDILTHQEVRDAMKFIDGDFEINKSPRLLAAVRVVTNSILGPLSGVRDAASIAANSLPYMRVQDLPTLITSLGDMKSAWRKSLEYGARTGAHPLDAIATPLGTDNVVNAANVVSENLRKWSGRDAIEQFNRAWTYSIGKQLANQAVLSGNKAFLKKFGTLADVKGSDGKVKWDTDIMASNFVDRVQGTYGGRGLPAVAVDGMAAPWFALARWSLEKANVTWQDVIKPAYKGENYLPLLTYSLGTWLTGEAIESLNEALQAGKKSQNANWKEIEAADGGIEQEALRLANVMQLGSFLGMTGDMVKVGADLYKGNTPRGYSVPLADFISEGVIGNMTKFSRAVQDGANPIDALQSLMNDLAKSQWQAYRVGNYWANRDEVERTNKFRDLRVYKQTTGQEVPSEVPQANSAFRADEREFKRSTEPLDAAEKLRGVLDRFREEYKNDPAAMAKALRRLKSNSYQTFPSPQRDIADARKYYAYLTKAYGAEEADARVQDYLRQTKLNSLKSAAIPTLSR